METVALAWAQEGISTVAEAKNPMPGTARIIIPF